MICIYVYTHIACWMRVLKIKNLYKSFVIIKVYCIVQYNTMRMNVIYLYTWNIMYRLITTI